MKWVGLRTHLVSNIPL